MVSYQPWGPVIVAQVVVALKSDSLSKATSVAALKDARLGAQQGTTSFDAITNVQISDSHWAATTARVPRGRCKHEPASSLAKRRRGAM